MDTIDDMATQETLQEKLANLTDNEYALWQQVVAVDGLTIENQKRCDVQVWNAAVGLRSAGLIEMKPIAYGFANRPQKGYSLIRK